MAVWNETTLSKVGRYTTLSADYYMPEFEKANDSLKTVRSQVLQLRWLIKPGFPITYGVLKPRDVESGAFRLARIHNSEGLFIFANDLPPISPVQFDEYARSEVRLGDIVVAIGGYIGPLGVISEVDGLRININRHLARISADPELIDPYYLAAYLACNISQSLLRREIRGAVQAGINLADLKLHPVFIPSEKDQKSIGDQMRYAEDFLKKARVSFADAQNLLESELGLDKLNFKKPVGYTARFSELEQVRRTDAEFFQPKYQSIIELIRERPYSTLGALFHISRGICLNPNLYNDNKGIPYLRIKELSLSQPLDPINSVKIPFQFVSSKFPTADNGDYILAVIGATIGKINLIDEPMGGSLYSNNTACLSPKSPLNWPNAMELILRSPIVQHQVQQRMAKTAQEKITDPELKKILIPNPNSGLMSDLEKLCLDSKKNYFESKRLLNQAKTLVDQLIEEAAAR